MFINITRRFLHTSRINWATDKNLLGNLRKKTGYSFVNCKKALELNEYDINKAENWLKEQAQVMGWTKATKLEGRSTKQGLIGVTVENNCGAIAEINCETDFVARNENFQKMVSVVLKSCLNYCKKQTHGSLLKIGFDSEQLKGMSGINGKNLGDELALMIGTLGENASLRRALCFKAPQGLFLSSYVHPAGQINDGVSLGKFGSLVVYRSETRVDEFAKGICQHIVGMKPRKIGGPEDKPTEDADEEICLIYQQFYNEDVMVKDLLQENRVEVVDFQRFECGENLEAFVSEESFKNNVCQ